MTFQLLQAARSVLLCVDVQERLLPAVERAAAIEARLKVLMQIAQMAQVPVLATEQNPAGIGHTVASLARYTQAVIEKLTFDATRAEGFFPAWPQGREQAVLCGLEAHICVFQTAIGLKDRGYRVTIASDATGTRDTTDKEIALAALGQAGVRIASVEQIAFEWLGRSDHPRFRDMLSLIK